MGAARFVFVGLAVLAACDDYAGARLVIDGKPANIEFDRVELFFGGAAGNDLPIPPTRVTMQDPIVLSTGNRYNRAFSPTDIYALPKAAHVIDFSLPPGQPQKDYIAVVAYAGQNAVGIGEVIGYEVPDDKIYQYEIALEPITSKIELWGDGNGPACLYWEKPGRKPIAVVRPGDPDCDDVRAQLDCDGFVYCNANSTSCPIRGDGSCAHNTGPNCLVGSCAQGQGCVDEICAMPALCGTVCESQAQIDGRWLCGVDETPTHLEAFFPADMDRMLLCIPAVAHVEVPLDGVACDAPIIESPPFGDFGDFKVTVDPFQPGTTGCTLAITPLTTTPPMADNPHVVISIAANGPPPMSTVGRWTFVVGLNAELVPACDGAMSHVDKVGELWTCPAQ